jgi:integrase
MELARARGSNWTQVGSIRYLRWEDIDFERKTIRWRGV